MPDRHRAAVSALPSDQTRFAMALRKTFKAGYGGRDFRADVLAGLVVGVVALPLSMALAIASGVPPQHGLYTAIIGGGIIALLGGSSVQVSGPTAAFVVILAPIATKFGVGGLLVATLMAGLLLMTAGMTRLGRLVEFIPYPVTTGFTSGIAVVIATLQIKDFFGLTIEKMPEHFLERVYAIMRALPTTNKGDLAIGVITLLLLIVLPRLTKAIPAPLVALPVGAIAGYFLARFFPAFQVATINSRFGYVLNGVTHHGIPQLPPMPLLPWLSAGPDGHPLVLTLDLFRSLLGPAFAIATLGAIESLLSAVVADGMTGGKHDPDAELIGQGLGNVVAPFFGGIAATGAIARTATNIRYGARSPIAAITHALFILAAVLLIAPLLGYLPMASMAALLMVVAWNMSEAKHVVHVVRVGPGSDVLVLLACFGLTVIFDMVISVSVGVVLAAILFMRRMAEVSSVRLISASPEHPHVFLPPGVIIYEIAGPLFFGAAQKAMSELRIIERQVKTIILDLSAVPIMDATGLVNLESAIERLRKAGTSIIMAGVQPQPLRVIAKAGWRDRHDWMTIRRSLDDGIALAWARHATGE
jgi:SulP family sulfate permease